MFALINGLLPVLLAVGQVTAGPADGELLLGWGKNDLGKVPRGWEAAQTGKGEGSVWKVVEDSTAPSRLGLALAQTAEGPNGLFNLCVNKNGAFLDGELTVAFKAVRGKLDQGGGLVWHYRDADHYYLTRYNPLEHNFRVYKVVAGKRTQLGTKEDLRIPAGEWHTVAVRTVGDRIECFLDGAKYLEVRDKTFPEGGKVGVWTKADAQTHFDVVQVKGARE